MKTKIKRILEGIARLYLSIANGMIATDRITLLYFCPSCEENSEQLLTSIVENGTHTCQCGTDMKLKDRVKVG